MQTSLYPITAVQDRLGLTVAGYKTLRGITGTSLDALITSALAMATQLADRYMQNPFLSVTYVGMDDLVNWDGNRIERVEGGHLSGYFGDLCLPPGGSRTGYSAPQLYPDDAVELSIPEAVKLGVVALMDAILNEFSTTSNPVPGSIPATPGPVLSEKVGELARTYANREDMALADASAYLGRYGAIAETYWRPYRRLIF